MWVVKKAMTASPLVASAETTVRMVTAANHVSLTVMTVALHVDSAAMTAMSVESASHVPLVVMTVASAMASAREVTTAASLLAPEKKAGKIVTVILLVDFVLMSSIAMRQ